MADDILEAKTEQSKQNNALEEIRKGFESNYNKETDIEKRLNELDKEIVNKKFNPKTDTTMNIYTIMDDVKDWQNKISRILNDAIDYEAYAKTLEKTFDSFFKDFYSVWIGSEELRNKGFKNLDEKKSWIINKINTEYKYSEYIRYAENQLIMAERVFDKAKNIMDMIDEQQEIMSRKISVMQIQKDIGLLKATTVEDVK